MNSQATTALNGRSVIHFYHPIPIGLSSTLASIHHTSKTGLGFLNAQLSIPFSGNSSSWPWFCPESIRKSPISFYTQL